MDELFILTNSPGEVSGWVRPVVSELTLLGFAAKIYLVVLPCQYASGMEAEYGKEIVGRLLLRRQKGLSSSLVGTLSSGRCFPQR